MRVTNTETDIMSGLVRLGVEALGVGGLVSFRQTSDLARRWRNAPLGFVMSLPSMRAYCRYKKLGPLTAAQDRLALLSGGGVFMARFDSFQSVALWVETKIDAGVSRSYGGNKARVLASASCLLLSKFGFEGSETPSIKLGTGVEQQPVELCRAPRRGSNVAFRRCHVPGAQTTAHEIQGGMTSSGARPPALTEAAAQRLSGFITLRMPMV